MAVLEFSAADLWLADHIYRWEGGAWRWRQAWLTVRVIHDGGRALVGVAALALAGGVVWAQVTRQGRPWRSGLWYVVCAVLGSALLVYVLKALTHVDCPWSLARYGGTKAYVPLWAALPAGVKPGVCFPAGHASAAYAWFGLYYGCVRCAPRWRWRALCGVVLLGLTFGIGQQLRGAHFLSHDVATMGLCWLWATLLYLWWFRAEDGPRVAAA
jgi:membrane-associated PAP2 superfamily phosphatase